jgi:Protein of unknown function (DUF2934)
MYPGALLEAHVSKQKKPSGVSNITPFDATEDMIRLHAYELFEQRGYEHGHDVEDWLQAETELRSNNNHGTRAPQTSKHHKESAA